MRVLGIDPGLSGGLAVIDTEARRIIDAIDIPVAGVDAKRRPDVAAIRDWLQGLRPVEWAYCERAQAMPDQGSSSGFNYGRAVGYLEAVPLALMIPLSMVEASSWKRHFALRGGVTDGKKSDAKEAARQLVLQRYPASGELFRFKYTHGRAEAVLIAEYGHHRRQQP